MSSGVIRIRNGLLFACLAALLTGCMHFLVDFRVTDSSFKPRSGSLAVISGLRKEQSVAIAMLLNEALHRKSRFRVMPNSRITHLVKPYPADIKGPYKSAYFDIDMDWDLSDRQKIAHIQRELGVNYLLVIWAPIAVSQDNSPLIQIPVVAQMFEPGGKVVATSQMTLMVGDKGNKYLHEGADGIAEDIAKKTGMSRDKTK